MKSFEVLAVTFLVTLIACAPGPAPNTDTAVPTPVAYLNGVETSWSVPIDRLGDVDLLGPDSVMRDALVAGDEDLLVVSSVFRIDDVYTLDVIVLNKTGTALRLDRGDLHLVDAEGRWLTPRPEFAAAARHGLRGRGLDRRGPAATAPFLHDLFDPARDAEAAVVLPVARSAEHKDAIVEDDRRDRTRDETSTHGIAALDLENDERTLASPSAVQVRDDDGKVFWAYFDDAAPQFPLTAMVLLGDEQYLFRFDR